MEEEQKDINTPKTGKRKYLKKILKILSYTFLGIIVLNVILYILLLIPPVQHGLVNFALDKLRPIVKTEMSIDRVRIGLFNHVNLKGVYIEDQSQDTLVYAGNLDVKISLLKLFSNKLQINSLHLDDVVINVSQDSVDAPYNFQFLIDAFSSDTTEQDTSSSSMKIAVEGIKITNTNLNYNVLSEPETPGLFNTSHISVKDLNSELDLASIDILDLDVTVKSLSLAEKSGFRINNLEGVLLSQEGSLFSKKLTLTLPNSMLDISGFEFNLFKKELAGRIESKISPRDIDMFMSGLNQLQNDLTLTSDISGKLPLVSIDNLVVNYGEDLNLEASASISDYANYGESKINLNIEKFRITPKAIVQFARIGDSTFIAPDMLSEIEYVRLKGSLDGFLNNMNIDAEAWTNQGSAQIVGKAATDTTFEDFKADVRIQTQNLNLASFAGKESGLGRLTMHSDISVASIKDLSAEVSGVISELQYEHDLLKNIRFKGQYSPEKMNAWIDASLPFGKLAGNASMTQGRTRELDVNMRLQDLLVDRFYQNPSWENPKLSLVLKGKFKGKDIDNLAGAAVLDSLRFWGDNFNFQPGRFVLESGLDNRSKRFVSLNSSLLNASISGDYYFEPLVDEFSNIMHQYLPSFFAENKRLKTYKNNFDFTATIKNTENLGKIFELPADIIQPVNIVATVNTIEDKINLNADIPFVRFGETEIKETRVSFYNTNTSFNVNAVTKLPEDKTNTAFMKFDLDVVGRADTINTLLTLNSSDSEFKIDGQLNALAHFETDKKELVSKIWLLPTNLNVGELKFSVLPASIINSGNETRISNFGIALNQKKYFGVDGVVSDQQGDSVKVYFNHAQISDILTALKIDNIRGEANGEVILTNVLVQPEVYTRGLNLADIVVFGDTLGTFNIDSRWSNTQKAVLFDASLVNKNANSVINGFVGTAMDSIDINLNLDRLSLNWLQPFMVGTLSQMSGSISSKINVKGSVGHPVAKGWLGFNDMYIGADYTNVTYHISDTIKVLPDSIGFRDLRIEDNNKNTAILSALVSHKNFKDFQLKANLDLNKFLILNTASRTDSLFYGRLQASGNVKVRGNMDDLNVTMNIRNDENSNINITLPQTSEASDYESIVYINTPKQDSTETYIETSPAKEANLPLYLSTALNLNPKLLLGVVINPVTGDAMQMKGSALINFSYDMKTNDMRAFGSYVIDDGFVRLRLQNIKTLEFKIKEGSKVNLPGDPMQASFDITAYKRVRASLATLDSEGFSDSRVYVDCVLGIKGNMRKMELTYDVSLPDSNDDVKQKLRSLINTDDKKIKQFAYLIATGSFYSESSGGGGNFGSNMLTSVASGALSKGLDALFGNMLGGNWQIGTEISAEDGSFSNVDMRVNVSTRIFDDKLKLNTNLGYRTDQTASTNESQFIGDFDIEYDLTNTVKLKAFNRTNDRIYRQAPTTQGIGIVYTKEAKRIKDLFRTMKWRRRNQNSSSNQTQNNDKQTQSSNK